MGEAGTCPEQQPRTKIHPQLSTPGGREQSAQRFKCGVVLEQAASQWSGSRRSLVVQRKAHRNGVHLVLCGQATREGLSWRDSP